MTPLAPQVRSEFAKRLKIIRTQRGFPRARYFASTLGIEENRYSWTWAVPDDALRKRAAAETRRWAEERLGRLDEVPRRRLEWRFASYIL